MTAFAQLVLEAMSVVLDNYTRLRPAQEPTPLDYPFVIEVFCTRKVGVGDYGISQYMDMPDVAEKFFIETGTVRVDLVPHKVNAGKPCHEDIERVVEELQKMMRQEFAQVSEQPVVVVTTDNKDFGIGAFVEGLKPGTHTVHFALKCVFKSINTAFMVTELTLVEYVTAYDQHIRANQEYRRQYPTVRFAVKVAQADDFPLLIFDGRRDFLTRLQGGL